jgi:hypothetical protein
MSTLTETQEFVAHHDPVWRERSNFIINAELPEKDWPRRFDQLFARRAGDDLFEVCCIPFALYDVALGDIVTVRPSDDRKFVVRDVVKPQYRSVKR